MNFFNRAVTRLLFVILSTWSFNVFSQDTIKKNRFEPALNTYLGMVIKAYPDVPDSRYASLSSVNLTWQTSGRDHWQQFYRFPKFGVELFYGTYDNKNNLGYNVGFVPNFEYRGKKPNKNWRLKFGIGATYFNKPFDPISNPNNFYIGGHFANMSIGSILWTRSLSRNLKFTYGFAAIHCSNGHTTLPNAGMNILTGHVGLRFEKENRCYSAASYTSASKLTYAIKAGIGFHKFGSTTKAVGGPTYPSYHLSLWVSKPIRQMHLIQAGITTAYYTSFYDYIKSQEVYSSNQNLKASTGLAFIGHEFVFGKFSFSSQAGIYFYNPFFIKQKKIEGTWSSFSEKLEAINTNRLGLLYYPLKKRNKLNDVKNQLMFGAFIKANLAQADLFEYSIGYVF